MKKKQAKTVCTNSKKMIERVNAIGITAQQGPYAAVFAHKDIAFKFASWISAKFELYVIKD
ncbi:MAG: KilA-N domain-containing protein [Candidatus Bathyarchaeota archaeon]|nr:KilA-N domain-containing protein [Candidatus Termiticorpusculum sp.]